MERKIDISFFGIKIEIETSTILPVFAMLISVVALIVTFNAYKSVESSKLLIGFVGPFFTFIVSYVVSLYNKQRVRRVFVSYNTKDKAYVQTLINDLKANAFKVYDDQDVKVGDNIRDSITTSIEKADLVVFILSQNAAESKWMALELKYAVSSHKKIFPIIIDRQAFIPEELQDLRYADLSSGSPELKEELIHSLKAVMNKS